MWLRIKSRLHNHTAHSRKFACSSFKDVHALLSDGAAAAAGSPKLSICHRTCSIKSPLRSPSQPVKEEPPPPPPEPEIRIPNAEQSVVVYFTSLGIIRRTFEDCKDVRAILHSFRVSIDERDVSMDSAFTDELQRILGKSKLTLPRVFIGGRYIGGAEEVRRLNESGELKSYIEGLPVAVPGTCEACGGYRFVLCQECDGSHKCYSEKGGFRRCALCNENGLIRCPACSSAALL